MDSLCILLVDDDLLDVKAAKRALAVSGVPTQIYDVRDGRSALAYLRRDQPAYMTAELAPRPNLILLDMHMPEMDGLTFLRELRADPALREIPVVALTSAEDDAMKRGAYQTGVAGYFIKPMEFTDYLDICETLCRYWLRSARPPVSTSGVGSGAVLS